MSRYYERGGYPRSNSAERERLSPHRRRAVGFVSPTSAAVRNIAAEKVYDEARAVRAPPTSSGVVPLIVKLDGRRPPPPPKTSAVYGGNSSRKKPVAQNNNRNSSSNGAKYVIVNSSDPAAATRNYEELKLKRDKEEDDIPDGAVTTKGKKRKEKSRSPGFERPDFGEVMSELWENARALGDRSRSDVMAVASGIYATILIVVYVAFSFTELAVFPLLQKVLELDGFFLYLYLVADVFLLYTLGFTLFNRKASVPRITENKKSHGSLAVRYGAVFFGLGTVCYFLIELLEFVEIEPGSPCHEPVLGANVVAVLLMVILQTLIIFVYPRLNLGINTFIDRMGTMHLVATNVILWIRTLIKESLHEIVESQEVIAEMHGAVLNTKGGRERGHRDDYDEYDRDYYGGRSREEEDTCDPFLDRIREAEEEEERCAQFRTDILGDTLHHSSPFLYPFVIEYVLIGASVLFIMWRHVGKRHREGPNKAAAVIHRPNPRRFVAKGDCSHSLLGFIAGLVVFAVGVINLSLFFGLAGHETNERVYLDEAELFSKITNTVINSIGIAGLILGILQIQSLEHKTTEEDEEERASSSLDLGLLRMTSFFAYLYLVFTVITGACHDHEMHDHESFQNFPSGLHVANGVVEAAQITLQIIFIVELKSKESQRHRKPGRHVTLFLFFLNLSQWLVFTFEIQKVRASLVEVNFYGFMPWVLVQRVTLPLTVFFRFHSAVVNIELWKEVYKVEEEEEAEEEDGTADAEMRESAAANMTTTASTML